MVLVDSEVIAKRNKPIKRLWKRADQDTLKRELHDIACTFMNSFTIESPIETLWTAFKDGLLTALNNNVPQKMTSTRHSEPWINKGIKSLSRRKKRAYRQCKHSTKYKKLKQLAQKEKRKAYNKYINDIFCDDFKDNPKKFWSFIKSKRCDSSGISPLKHNGITHINPKAKANILNQQFVSVFSDTDSSDLPDMGPSPHPDLHELDIQQEGVRKLMDGLDPYKANGPDNIPTRLLKEHSTIISGPLSLLYQASIHQGCIPDDWRKANISPIFKKGDKTQAANYRPISLTSVCCKLLEHIVHSHIMIHLNNHNILNDAQHGFRKSRSTKTQLLTTVNEHAKCLNSGEQRDSILLDFLKHLTKCLIACYCTN